MNAPPGYRETDAPVLNCQGHRLTDDEIQTIISRLKDTHMSVSAIAESVGCGRMSVLLINRKFGVRNGQSVAERHPGSLSPIK